MAQNLARVGASVAASKGFIRQFSGIDVKLVVLPEYFLTGFPMGESIPVWRDKAALAIDGPEYQGAGGHRREVRRLSGGQCLRSGPALPGTVFPDLLHHRPQPGNRPALPPDDFPVRAHALRRLGPLPGNLRPGRGVSRWPTRRSAAWRPSRRKRSSTRRLPGWRPCAARRSSSTPPARSAARRSRPRSSAAGPGRRRTSPMSCRPIRRR